MSNIDPVKIDVDRISRDASIFVGIFTIIVTGIEVYKKLKEIYKSE